MCADGKHIMFRHKVIVAIIITAMLVALGAWAGHALSRKRHEPDTPHEQIIGALIGALIGLIIGLLVLWFMVKGNPMKKWAFDRKWNEGVRASKNM